MKSPWLPMFLLATGVAASFGIHASTSQMNDAAARLKNSLDAQSVANAQKRHELDALTLRVEKLRRDTPVRPVPAGQRIPQEVIDFKHGRPLTAKQRQQLLAEFGYSWNSFPDYLIVTKQTLKGIGVPSIAGRQASDTAMRLLAVTPDEKAGVDALINSIFNQYAGWAETHLQRTEPANNVLAQYSLPEDTNFLGRLGDEFRQGASSTLGVERGELFVQFSTGWMGDLGMFSETSGGAATMTVTKSQDNGAELNLAVHNFNGSTMSCGVQPAQPMPNTFLPLFPNGWPDLAARAGFQLPKSFSSETPQ